MPESEAWAIATQQSHALGKSPKNYGTPEGRAEARDKYKTPGDDEKAAKGHDKAAGLLHLLRGDPKADDERLRKVVREELQNANLSTHNHISSHTMKSASIDYPLTSVLISGFANELHKIKIAQLAMSNIAPKPTTISKVTSSVPRNTLNAATPRYSQVNPAPAAGPAQQHQPVLSPPAVRG